MFGNLAVLAVVLLYMAGLFSLALWVERSEAGRRLAASAPVYALSLAVYCTSWTFFGCVGSVAGTGMLFMTTYLGPTLAAVLWWSVLRRMVRIKHRFRITSIADFLAARYGKCPWVGGLAALAALVGSMPYIALQMKSIGATFAIIGWPAGRTGIWVGEHSGPIFALLLTAFTIIFGVRRVDPTERHPGIVVAVAAESLVKLAAFLACGLCVVFWDSSGFTGLLQGMQEGSTSWPGLNTLAGDAAAPYALWTTNLLLAASAILFLPRQFHTAVVENSSENHIRTAMWLLPLYLLLISLFMVPIAVAGHQAGIPQNRADTTVLLLPMLHGRAWLALLVFIGGFSAAMSMIMISSMTAATMLVNHLVLPLASRAAALAPLRRHGLRCRWVGVAATIGLGLWFERMVGESYALVNMGVISFAAAVQFAPPILGGLFWTGAHRAGALLGLGSGMAVWSYTLLLPALAKSGWISRDLLLSGPLGISLLRPEALLGLTGLDPLTHAVFWSLAANLGLFVLGSLAFRQDPAEATLARSYVHILGAEPMVRGAPGEALIPLEDKVRILAEALRPFYGRTRARLALDGCLRRLGLAGRERVSLHELSDLRTEAEHQLAGAVGSSVAHGALADAGLLTPAETDQLSRQYADILADLNLPPEELRRRIDYYQEREALIARHAAELERTVEVRTRDLAAKARELTHKAHELEEANIRLQELDRMKSAFLSSVSHELRTPLTSVLGFAKLIRKDLAAVFASLLDRHPEFRPRCERALDNLEIISDEGERLTRLINDVLDLTRIEDGRMAWRDQDVPLRQILDRAAHAVSGQYAANPAVRLVAELPAELPVVRMDPDHLLQVLLNILGNAGKFTAAGEVRMAAGPSPRGGCRVTISDTGSGIAAEDLPRIFDAFYQAAPDTLSDKPKGTGLGLSICRRIMDHYGGSIEVESEPGRGSIFHVDIPSAAVVGPAPPASARENGAAPPPAPDRPPTVLAAHADPAVCAAVAELLASRGYEVVTAHDGPTALAAARGVAPDLAVLDLFLPAGHDTVFSALRNDPDLRRIPQTLIPAPPVLGHAGGRPDFDTPFDRELLAEAVDLLLDRSRDACAYALLLTAGEDAPDTASLPLCPDGVRTVSPRELWEYVETGYEGAVLVPGRLADDLDLERMVREPRIQVLVLPEENSPSPASGN
ncbi:MAG: ATP-binding protein [Thermodesulfobacteriota bacterium]